MSRLIFFPIFFPSFLSLTLLVGGTAHARANLLQVRQQKVAEADAVLDLLKRKVNSYEIVFKAVTALSAGSLSKEQILHIKSWSQNFQSEYNGIHEKLLDKEDEIYRLDQRIQGEGVDRYLKVSNNRFETLGKIGGNLTKQRVDLHTYLEGEIDELNRQSSDAAGLPAKKPRNNDGWRKIADLLQAPAITADTPIHVAAPIPPTPSAPGAPQRQIANVASIPPPASPAKLATALPSKQVIRFEEQEPEISLDVPVANPAEPCPKLKPQVLRQYRDGKTDLFYVTQQIHTLNQLIFLNERSEDDIDRRFSIYNQLLPLGFFDGKIAQSQVKLSSSDRQRWRHLNYLAQVRMIHLYEESVRAAAEKIQKIFSREKFNQAWSERLFSPEKSYVSSVGFSGGASCAAVKSLKQARKDCRLTVDFRFGGPLICRPNMPRLAQAAFRYSFAFNEEAGRWVLDEVTAPLPARDDNGQISLTFQAAFADFEKRAMNPQETLSSLESWIQQGLKSSDLLGYDGYLQRQAEINERSIASKRDTLD